jgi:hypothetical protein
VQLFARRLQVEQGQVGQAAVEQRRGLLAWCQQRERLTDLVQRVDGGLPLGAADVDDRLLDEAQRTQSWCPCRVADLPQHGEGLVASVEIGRRPGQGDEDPGTRCGRVVRTRGVGARPAERTAKRDLCVPVTADGVEVAGVAEELLDLGIRYLYDCS